VGVGGEWVCVCGGGKGGRGRGWSAQQRASCKMQMHQLQQTRRVAPSKPAVMVTGNGCRGVPAAGQAGDGRFRMSVCEVW
jgi:hypothetical protein